ncbi:MAG: aminotransferase class III-fold pyridoxal phosphate-dependent enzyme [Candidatus Aminicenantes bacterium]|nr:aminotransferase class III-fold pyridoxal phosphate-dependent enzyme [Candidatus Aminicenantes bacterium]
MNERKIQRLRIYLEEQYRRKTPRSRALFRRAEKVMVGGGSHTLRLYHPYPFFVTRARGAELRDADGLRYVDYWQGHYANILGHNPELIREGMRPALRGGALHSGFEAAAQIELAEVLIGSLGQPRWKVRFTTSGTLAAMYAVMLAKAVTGREYVLKVGGGWHGASPDLLKGVKYHGAAGFGAAESAGLAADIFRKTLITPFNDCARLARVFKIHGHRIAGFILEPYLGVGGFVPADREYLALARKLTQRHGAILVFDEVISGFRLCPGPVFSFYGIAPDLAVFGKIIGGGHAVAAVAGRPEIMAGCGAGSRFPRVLFEGGTFSGHAEYMTAGAVMLRHLIGHEKVIYPRLAAVGRRLRQAIEDVFEGEGIEARTTGSGNDVVRGGSLFMVHFPVRPGHVFRRPEDSLDERASHLALREETLKLALAVEGVHVVHGGGAVSVAHEERHLEKTVAAYGAAARLFRKYLF